MNDIRVDSYLRDGCGRCDRYRTPACKVHRWTPLLESLRELLLASELVETMKWGSPCYMLDDENVVLLASFNDFCAVSFFDGAALVDDGNHLERPGPNSRLVRYLKFVSMDEVVAKQPLVERFVRQAIEWKRSGRQVVPNTATEPIPAEIERLLGESPDLRLAFERLTPGRRRSHVLHVSGAKRPETRGRRAAKCIPKILAGKGFNER